jgi:hypothetical protein
MYVESIEPIENTNLMDMTNKDDLYLNTLSPSNLSAHVYNFNKSGLSNSNHRSLKVKHNMMTPLESQS